MVHHPGVRQVRTVVALGAALVVLAGVHPGEASGQRAPGQRGSTIALLAGASEYDLSGTGWTWFAAMRWESGLTSFLFLGPSIQYFQYDGPVGERVRYLVPEAQAQLRLPVGRVQPYLIAGAGVAWLSRVVDDELDIALSAGAGLRGGVSSTLGMVLEARVRSIDPWTGSTLDVGIGIFRR